MKHELKIIIKCETEDIDDNGNYPINSNIIIYLDNTPIGMVQKFKLEADCKKMSPIIEFDFLNFDDPTYFKQTALPSRMPYIHDYTEENIDKLSMIKGVKINLRNLFDENINEIGTDGIIDKIRVGK